MIGIYKITSPSGRIYIGQSKDLNRRERDYQKYIKDSNSQVKLLASINKYNWENHIFEIIEEYCEKVGLLYKDTFIYYGKAKDLFNIEGLGTDEFSVSLWQNQFLNYLESKYNEKDCYMCVNKVPEEGIVLRIEHLEEYEAYKLKSKRFTLMESEAQEKEEINIEDEQEDSV